MLQIELDATIAAVFTVGGPSTVEEVLHVTSTGDVYRTPFKASSGSIPVLALRGLEPVGRFETVEEAVEFALEQTRAEPSIRSDAIDLDGRQQSGRDADIRNAAPR